MSLSDQKTATNDGIARHWESLLYVCHTVRAPIRSLQVATQSHMHSTRHVKACTHLRLGSRRGRRMYVLVCMCILHVCTRHTVPAHAIFPSYPHSRRAAHCRSSSLVFALGSRLDRIASEAIVGCTCLGVRAAKFWGALGSCKIDHLRSNLSAQATPVCLDISDPQATASNHSNVSDPNFELNRDTNTYVCSGYVYTIT